MDRPPDNSSELIYMHQRRQELGGPVPTRGVRCDPLPPVPDDIFEEFKDGSSGRDISTTMAFVRVLTLLTRDRNLKKYLVPIVADEARTFGMEGMFRQLGIYAPHGQLYTPVDAGQIAPYKEARDGQILQEGITEAGAICSWMAAGTAYANHGLPMIPFVLVGGGSTHE